MLAPVDVEQVAHRLERVKGDAHRQREVQESQLAFAAESLEQAVDIGQGKIGVFHPGQQAEVEQHARHQVAALAPLERFFPCLALVPCQADLVRGQALLVRRRQMVDPPCGQERRDGRQRDVDQILRAGQEVEQVAGKKKQHPLDPARHQVVGDKEHQDEADKTVGCEEHAP